VGPVQRIGREKIKGRKGKKKDEEGTSNLSPQDVK